MAIENTGSNHFYSRSSIFKKVFDCHLSGVILVTINDFEICDNPRCQIIPGAIGPYKILILRFWPNKRLCVC